MNMKSKKRTKDKVKKIYFIYKKLLTKRMSGTIIK